MKSANGWRVLKREECVTIDVPGGGLLVHPRAAPIFADLARRFHTDVEPLMWPGCWGYALRPIKGTDVYSNHSSGTAVDLCAPKFPQGVPATRTFTRRQRSALAEILADYDGVITWGGTWDLPDTDGMHFELTEGVSVEAVDALVAKLARGAAPVPPPPAPAPPPRPAPAPAPAGFTGPDLTGTGAGLRGDQGSNGPRVAAWQAWLAATYPAYRHALGDLAADGWWGPVTTAWNREFAHRSGIPSADGANIGPKLAAAYWRAGLFRSLSAARRQAVGHVTRTARR